ncbi:MAG: hypothetical protein ACXVJO_16150 [Thermoanaerobaculia bacterium]
MAKPKGSKTRKTSKPSVKVQDLTPEKKDPKGGAYEFYVSVKGKKQGPF